MTISAWRRSRSLGEMHADLVVIGAGICGISAALHAQRRGLRVVVLEQHRAGWGASTRNAGFLMRGCADNYQVSCEHHGREKTATLWRLTEANLAGLRREGILALPSVRTTPSVLLALQEAEREQLARSLVLMREDGFEASWLDRGDDSLWSGVGTRGRAAPLGALVNPHDAACNPRDVLSLLRGKLSCPLLEGQEVFAFDREARAVRVRHSDGETIAARVMVCTNAYVPLLLPGFEGHVAPKRGQMLALTGHGLRLDASYYANFGSEYFRQAHDGTVVVGGCRTYHAEQETGYEDRTTPPVQRDLEAFAASVLGTDLRVVARWSGVMGFSSTHLPIITPVDLDAAAPARPGSHADAPVWFCGGFTGHGMSMAYEVSRLALGAMFEGGQHMFAPAPGSVSGSVTGG